MFLLLRILPAAIIFSLVSPAVITSQERPAGPETRTVAAIEFVGNKFFDGETLRKKLQLIQPGFSWNPGAFEADIEMNLKSFLKEKGFVRCEATWEEIPEDEKAVRIRIHLSEGPQYRLSILEVEGSSVFSQEELISQVGLHAGDVLNFARIRNALQKIKRLYSDHGFINFAYLPEQIFEEDTQTMRLKFTMVEDIPFSVAYVGFVGCKDQAQEDSLRSLIPLRPRDLFRESDVESAVDVINKLGLFEPLREEDRAVQIVDEKNGLVGIVFKLKLKAQ